MSNEIEQIGKDIIHAVEYPFVHTAQFIAVLNEAIKNEPPVKQAIIGLVQAAEQVVAETGEAAVDKGLNVAVDIAAVTDAESFFAYFSSTFLPAVEAAYKDLKQATSAG